MNRLKSQGGGSAIQFEVNDYEFRAALLNFYRHSQKSLSEVIRSQARLVATNLVFQTQPFGGSKAVTGQDASGKALGEGKVASDIRKVIRTPADVYDKIEKQALGAGRAFYAMIKKGDFDLARNLLVRLRISGLLQAHIGTMSGSFHKQALKPIPKRPRMLKRQEPLLITDEKTKLKAYIKEVQKKVGIAKAGWAACAIQLGGTRGRSGAGGSEQQSVPAWVRRHAGGTGGGTVIDRSMSMGDAFVDMINHVPWISKCLSVGQQQKALDIQRFKMETAIESALDYEAGRDGFR